MSASQGIESQRQRLNKQQVSIYIGLFMVVVGSLIFISTSPMLTVNNRFVGYALLFFCTIFSLIFMVMKKSVLKYVLMAIFGMCGFAFALVPLYNVFCDVTGLNGKIDLTQVAATPAGIDESRSVTVEFVVNYNEKMPWDFQPKHTTLVLHPGQVMSTAYFAKNPTNRTMIAQAIPSISPSKVSKHFKKIQCFCFDSQQLGPGESAYLGLRFYLDPDFPEDVQRLTLAYTLFDITKDSDQASGGHHHG